MKPHAPYVFAFVFALAFLLLLVTFRSIVIPLKAIVLNLLSVAASYGVVVLVFQDGRLQSLLDFQSIGGITSWLPLFLFLVLWESDSPLPSCSTPRSFARSPSRHDDPARRLELVPPALAGMAAPAHTACATPATNDCTDPRGAGPRAGAGTAHTGRRLTGLPTS